MSSYPKTFVTSLIRLLVAFGALRINFERYGAITLTKIAKDILSDIRPFEAKKIVQFLKKTSSQITTQREEVKIENQAHLQILKNFSHKINSIMLMLFYLSDLNLKNYYR